MAISASTNPTLLDIAKLNNDDGICGLIEASIQTHPEMQTIATTTIPGQSYQTVIRTAPPTVGFRTANTGQASTKSTYQNKTVQTYILDASVETDKAVADTYLQGRDAFLAKEATGLLEGGMRALCSQLYYGTQTTVATSTAGTPTAGFPGLIQGVDSSMVVDATGTGSACSSVWVVVSGDDWLRWVVGQDGEFRVSDAYETRLTDASGNPFDGYRLPLLAYMGVQLVNPNAVVRIKNLTTATGKGLTDDLIYQALEKFPAGIKPTAMFMSRRSLRQLRESRTATNAVGAPAPIPADVEGVPIYATDAIVNTETAN